MFGHLRRLFLTTTALVPLGLAPVSANPLGAQVVGGSANVQGQGTAKVTVTQSTDKAIINWSTFNVGSGEKTQFVQPGSSSVALNRVTGGLGPSQIFGSLSANGRVFVVNPDGILIGSGAKIDTAGFLATTNDIANTDFMAGRYNFSIPGRPDASVVNQGTITAQNGGFAALVAPGVRNSGTITARLGSIAMASGNAFTLDFYGDKLITLGVSDSIAATVKDVSTGQSLRALVGNEGKLKANGGTVALTAVAARQVVNSVINNKGVIEANSIGTHNGKIVLGAPTAATKLAGTPAQTVNIAGKLSAAGKRKGTTGGTIEVTGEQIALTGAKLDASGRDGGGTVLVGGDTGGGNPNPAVASTPQAQLQSYAVPTASNVTIESATTIDASARDNGNGGKVVVWSDQTTIFDGTIKAKGGTNAGNGGFVETSGHRQLGFSGNVDTSAVTGKNGTLLLDPGNVAIGSGSGFVVSVAALQSALSGANVVVTTASSGSEAGDITVSQSFGWTTNNGLVLTANRNIIINDGVTITLSGAQAFLNLVSGVNQTQVGSTLTGVGTVIFNGTSQVDLSHGGSSVIWYNPPGGYHNAVDYDSHFLFPALNPTEREPAGMWVNTLADLQNIFVPGNYLTPSYSGPLYNYVLSPDISIATAQIRWPQYFFAPGISSIIFPGLSEPIPPSYGIFRPNSSALLPPTLPLIVPPPLTVSLPVFNQNTSNNLTLPIDTTMAGSTPPSLIPNMTPSPVTSSTSGTTSLQSPNNSSVVAVALQGTINQLGGSYQTVAGRTPSITTTTWGLTSTGFSPTGGTTTYAPIDTMTIVVNGQKKTLSAFADVDGSGKGDPEGPFQCTALVAQYLSLLGYKNAPKELPNGKDVAATLAKLDPEYFDTSNKSVPKVGTIISMETNESNVGHVAIVKGVEQKDSNTLVVTLIEDNLTFNGGATFAVNRQITFTKGTDGVWSATHTINPASGRSYKVLSWVTPTTLP